jgi:hypothetical protein
MRHAGHQTQSDSAREAVFTAKIVITRQRTIAPAFLHDVSTTAGPFSGQKGIHAGGRARIRSPESRMETAKSVAERKQDGSYKPRHRKGPTLGM